MKIYNYCKVKECDFYGPLEEPFHFKFGRDYVPLGEADKCTGFCGGTPHFQSIDKSVGERKYQLAICLNLSHEEFLCNRCDCLWNNNKQCAREEILVDRQLEFAVCKCYSQTKIRGHMDWSRYPQQDGVHLGDREAEADYQDSLKAKSYATHTRQAKEVKPRSRQ